MCAPFSHIQPACGLRLVSNLSCVQLCSDKKMLIFLLLNLLLVLYEIKRRKINVIKQFFLVLL